MLTKRIPYTFNRGGYYYFTRRVPTDLQKHYLCPRIVQGLNTLKWSGKTGQRAKMYPSLKTGYTNDEETQFFRQV